MIMERELARKKLIDLATSPDFETVHGEAVVKVMGKIIRDEIESARIALSL